MPVHSGKPRLNLVCKLVYIHSGCRIDIDGHIVAAGILTEKEAFKSFELLTVFMLAFMSPLGAAMNNTGAGQIIADKVIALTGNSGTFIIMAPCGCSPGS